MHIVVQIDFKLLNQVLCSRLLFKVLPGQLVDYTGKSFLWLEKFVLLVDKFNMQIS